MDTISNYMIINYLNCLLKAATSLRFSSSRQRQAAANFLPLTHAKLVYGHITNTFYCLKKTLTLDPSKGIMNQTWPHPQRFPCMKPELELSRKCQDREAKNLYLLRESCAAIFVDGSLILLCTA